MIAAYQQGAAPPQPAVIRPSVILVPLDAFGERVAETVIETVAATEPARGETCRVVSAHGTFERSALVSALLAVEQAAGNGGTRILTWLIGDLAADDPAGTLARAATVLDVLSGAVAPYRLRIDARCFWQAGPFVAREAALLKAKGGEQAAASDASGSQYDHARTLHPVLAALAQFDEHAAPLLSLGHWTVTGVGPAGPVVQSAAELVESCAVALEAILLTSHWPDLAVHPFFRCDAGRPGQDRIVGFAARLAYHPADEIARWVGERVVSERLEVFSTPVADAKADAESPPSFADAFEDVRLGPPDEGGGPRSPIVPTPWLASRAVLMRRLDLTTTELRAELTRWRLTVGEAVAAETAQLGAAGIEAAGTALQRVAGRVEAALKENDGGLHRALVDATAATRALEEQAAQETARLPAFPSPHRWTLARVEAARRQLAGLIVSQAEPLALLVYGLSALALLLVAAWRPLTRMYPDARGELYAIGGPLVVILTLVLGLGPIARFLLRRQLGQEGPLVKATDTLVGQLGTDARAMLGALSARCRLRAARRAVAVANDRRHQLVRVLALARHRVDALQTTPPTAEEFATSLVGRPKAVREPLLSRAATVSLAIEALGHYQGAFGEIPVAMTGSVAQQGSLPASWYGRSADAALAGYEAFVLDMCRQIAASGPRLTAQEMQALVRQLAGSLEPLVPLEAAALDRGTMALVLPTISPIAGLPASSQLTTEELRATAHVVLPQAHLGTLVSPNKLYALRVWAGLSAEDLVDVPLREGNMSAAGGQASRGTSGGAA